MGEVVNIKSTGRHIGCNENGKHAVAEFFHHDVALLLREVAVERVGIISVVYKVVGNLLCLAACTAKDDAVDVGAVVGNAFESEIFVASVNHIVYVVDIGSTFVACADDKLLGIVHVFFCNLGNFLGHGCREHKHFAFLGEI